MKAVYVLISIILITNVSISNAQQTTKKGELRSSTSSINKKIKKDTQKQNSSSSFIIKNDKYKKFNEEIFRSQNNIPIDFPVYKKTTDIKTGIEIYEKSVQLWIERNPNKYAEIKEVINF